MKNIRWSIFIAIVTFSSYNSAFAVANSDSVVSKYTCISFTKNLQFGNKDTKNSNEIAKLRNFLKEDRDFPTNTIDQLGYFGTNTRSALINFQKKQKINPTGAVGQITMARIHEISCSTTTTVSKITNTESVVSKKEESIKVVVKETPVVVVNEPASTKMISEVPTIYVRTLLATDITSSSATFNGNGGIDGEKHWFEWGKTMEMNSKTPETVTPTSYTYKITGLLPNTIYYFRSVTSVASSSIRKTETAYGEMRYFTTPPSALPAPAKPTVSISSTGIAVNTTGSAKIIWTSANANRCYFTAGEEGGDWTRQTSLSGEYITRPITKSTTFGINCRNNLEYTVTGTVTVPKIVN